MKAQYTKDIFKQKKKRMKTLTTLYAMLLFTALNTRAVAQYQKVASDSVIVTRTTDTLSVDEVLKFNEALPLDKRVELNKELFKALRKPD